MRRTAKIPIVIIATVISGIVGGWLCDDRAEAVEKSEPHDVLSAAAWPQEWASMEGEMLALVNRWRASGADCGSTGVFPAAPPLSRNDSLQDAARAYSREVASTGQISHVGTDGRTPGQRIADAGFRGRMTGENIAGGDRDAQSAVMSFMQSPNHCANIMRPEFQYIGVGLYIQPESTYGYYWTQTFGAP